MLPVKGCVRARGKMWCDRPQQGVYCGMMGRGAVDGGSPEDANVSAAGENAEPPTQFSSLRLSES